MDTGQFPEVVYATCPRHALNGVRLMEPAPSACIGIDHHVDVDDARVAAGIPCRPTSTLSIYASRRVYGDRFDIPDTLRQSDEGLVERGLRR